MKLHQLGNKIINSDGGIVAEIFHNSEAADIVERYNAHDDFVTAARAWCLMYEDTGPVPVEARLAAYIHTMKILVEIGVTVRGESHAA